MGLSINPHTIGRTNYVLLHSKKSITQKEIDTLLSYSQGNAYKALSHKEDRSQSAVKASLASIRDKLGAQNNSHALVLAIESGILEIIHPSFTPQ